MGRSMEKDWKFIIRDKITSNRYLRNLRNHYHDYRSITKYRIHTWQKNRQREDEKTEIEELTPQETEAMQNDILKSNISNIKIKSFPEDSPLVSILILNHNGLEHLKKLFLKFHENLQYPNYEVIVVDNASTDGSMEYLDEFPLKIKIIKNQMNRTFSESNNQAALEARGEYLLLLNNDVKPTYGWLNQMMQTIQKDEKIGAVGARLIYPYTTRHPHSFKIQHAGIAFRDEDGFLKPYNRGEGDKPEEHNQEKKVAGVTGAALLVSKKLFWEVGGLDEGYRYGYEDIDFCLKLIKKGYQNIYNPGALLFHYEFGTQEKDRKRKIKKRRQANRKLFKSRWNRWLQKQALHDKIENRGVFTEQPLKVSLVVTEVGEDASAGDYFTASELAHRLKDFGWIITYQVRSGPGNWYYVEDDVDVLISFLEAFDPGKIMTSNPLLIKVAWARNWFRRWIHNPSLNKFDLIFASSKTSCEYVEDETGLKTHLLPIATNPEEFHRGIGSREEYLNDYVFTGSYWNDPRDIVEYLEPDDLPYTFKLYGKNWEEFPKLKKYYQGFVEYKELPHIYASSKIVIDDVNRGSKKFGAVNSRVYDALASGALIITNGEIGAQETFEGKLPYYRDKKGLEKLINYYLSNEEERMKKVEELHQLVLEKHTYQIRADTVKETLLNEFVYKTRVSIKIPAPNWRSVQEWGDYHLATGLKKELEKKNCQVELQVLPEWNKNDDCDVVLVLRGLSRYRPREGQFNIMWNISHPNQVSLEEYNQYQHVFIASEYWAGMIKEDASVPVESLLQCTDPELFYPDPDEAYNYDLLFVGNSRKKHRRIIKDLLPTSYNLAVYGKNWKRFINRKYIKGKHIPYQELRRAYSSTRILLNDHWDDMRDNGFISNRIFDGFASGAFIISDNIKGAQELFDDALITYHNQQELEILIEKYLKNENLRREKSEKGKEIVLDGHTYHDRAGRILEVIEDNNLIPSKKNRIT
jgi:GT2 family glycosyltransferase/spore maturation protein CgeB